MLQVMCLFLLFEVSHRGHRAVSSVALRLLSGWERFSWLGCELFRFMLDVFLMPNASVYGVVIRNVKVYTNIKEKDENKLNFAGFNVLLMVATVEYLTVK